MSGPVGGATTATPVWTPTAVTGKEKGKQPATTDVMPENDRSGDGVSSGSIPVLDLPTLSDAAALMTAFLALKVESMDEQQKNSLEDIQATGKLQKLQNEEIAKKSQEAIKAMEDAGLGGIFAKVFGWIAVALTVVAAVATGGALAIAAAAIAVTMATLTETGGMDKLTEAIAKSLQDSGMSEADSKKWAMGIMMGISIAVSLTTLGAGALKAGTDLAANAVKIAQQVGKAAQQLTKAQMVASMAQVGSGVDTIGQQGAAIASAVHTRDAADANAEAAELRAFLAKLQQVLEDESDRVQQIVQQMQASFTTAMQIMNRQSDQLNETVRNMG